MTIARGVRQREGGYKTHPRASYIFSFPWAIFYPPVIWGCTNGGAFFAASTLFLLGSAKMSSRNPARLLMSIYSFPLDFFFARRIIAPAQNKERKLQRASSNKTSEKVFNCQRRINPHANNKISYSVLKSNQIKTQPKQ